jgi:hypothetical protein
MTNIYQITIILTFLSLNSSAQCFNAVKQAFIQKGFDNAVSVMKSCIDTNRNVSYHPIVNREIVKDFYELTVEFQEEFESEKKGVFDVYSYNIQLLLKGDSIIYCKILNKRNSRKKQLEHHYQDNIGIKELKSAYREFAGRELNWNELFNEEVVYGSRCSNLGIDPKFRVRLKDIVEKKDTSKLNSWLNSSITEVQVYAIDGFHQLYKLGLKPSSSQLKKINSIKSKKAEIQTCSGCIYWNRMVCEVTEEFTFDE